MNLRWLFVIIFAVGLVVSSGFGISAGPASSGWLTAAILSLIALAYTVWGEPDSRQSAPVVRPMMTHAAPAVLRLDTGMVIAEANPAAEQMFGYAPGKLAGVSLAAIVPSKAQDPAPALAPAPAPTKATVDRILLADYFDRAPVPLVVITRDGHIDRMNQQAELITEFAAAELRGQTYWDLFLAPIETSQAAEEYRDAMLERKSPPRRESWRTRTGSLARFEWWRTILLDEFGQASGVLAAGLPVAAESQVMDLTALADQLTAVNGYSEMLLMSMSQEDPIRNDVECIHRAGMAATSSLNTGKAA